jgi:hypothetical protein
VPRLYAAAVSLSFATKSLQLSIDSESYIRAMESGILGLVRRPLYTTGRISIEPTLFGVVSLEKVGPLGVGLSGGSVVL